MDPTDDRMREPLSPERIAAGREFLQSCDGIGLRPQTLLWMRDKQEDRLQLLFVSIYYDFIGPLAMNKLLIKAYNASLLPKEIDPFIVVLGSPNQLWVKIIIDSLKAVKFQSVDGQEPKDIRLTNDEYEIFYDGMYRLSGHVPNYLNYDRRWDAIERKVEELAA